MFEYADRLISNRTIYDIDRSEIWQLLFDEQLSSDECRKRLYGIEKFIKELKNEGYENISDNEMLEKIQQQHMEMQKEKIKIRTEKVELNRWLREEARSELFVEKMIDSINNLTPIDVPTNPIFIHNNDQRAIGGIADCHYGLEVDIKGLCGETINKYNDKIFEEHMWLLYNKYINIIQKENIKHLYFFNLGDSLEGILRVSQLQSLQHNTIDSTMKFAEFMANWLNELSRYVYIDYYSTTGNHTESRPLGSKKGEFPHENFERIINWYLQARLENNQNINIHDCDSKLQFVQVGNYNVLATHGENERKLEQSIKDYILLYGQRIDLLLTGHLHTDHSQTVGMNELGNIKYIQFPSVCGVSDYSMKLKKSSAPGSKLIILNGKDQITYDLVLN